MNKKLVIGAASVVCFAGLVVSAIFLNKKYDFKGWLADVFEDTEPVNEERCEELCGDSEAPVTTNTRKPW